jgi:myo-inositol-1(or 4)-monophosphatase
MLELAVDCVKSAGALLMDYRAGSLSVRIKENQSSIVTEADVASERCIVQKIQRSFPGHRIISEEIGLLETKSDFTWVVDPLDGTSNFAAGLPWFGVIVALFEGNTPIIGAMFLPASGELYTCERGGGVRRNAAPICLCGETNLAAVLCSYGLDASEDAARAARETRVLYNVARAVRNIRSTNSLVDFCYTLDGRIGACINQRTHIWDIAAAALMFTEAGGNFTDLRGNPIPFQLDGSACMQEYAIVGANPALHAELVALLAR